MKTTQTLTAEAPIRQLKVKRFLITGIVYLLSGNLRTFACVIAAIAVWWGILAENLDIAFCGLLPFLVTFIAGTIREIARDIRKANLGSRSDK